MKRLIFVASLLAPISSAFACGGLFSDADASIKQTAERVIFAQEGDSISMHIEISYQGPPTQFSWLLPVSPGVEDALSSTALFDILDSVSEPTFSSGFVFANCGPEGLAMPDDPYQRVDEGVEVLRRGVVGPYDRALLIAASVPDLRAWLESNGYSVPGDADGTLQPYVDAGSAFLALKLLPETGVGELQPIRLRFAGESMSIPILPSAVAAAADMRITVYVLGQSRAVPLNYLHARVNEGATDWSGFYDNYLDVVATVADAAGGHAFVTDYAGPNMVEMVLPLVELEAIRRATTVAELLQLWIGPWMEDPSVVNALSTIEGLPKGYFSCPGCHDGGPVDYLGLPVDGPALAARIEADVNAPRVEANRLLQLPYITRLSTTLDPEEMTLDPSFGFNPDLGVVQRERIATVFQMCSSDPEWAAVKTQGGVISTVLLANFITREDGQTVRGGDVPAVAVVEQLSRSGPPVVVLDNRELIAELYTSDWLQSLIDTRFFEDGTARPAVEAWPDDGDYDEYDGDYGECDSDEAFDEENSRDYYERDEGGEVIDPPPKTPPPRARAERPRPPQTEDERRQSASGCDQGGRQDAPAWPAVIAVGFIGWLRRRGKADG